MVSRSGLLDDQVNEYGRDTDTTHGLPECVSVYGIKSRLQIHKRDMQRLLEFSMNFLNRRNARIASSVERQRVNPDW